MSLGGHYLGFGMCDRGGFAGRKGLKWFEHESDILGTPADLVLFGPPCYTPARS